MIQLLLDTNILIWYFSGSDRINSIKELISSKDAEVYISAVSYWEIVLKVRTGKLEIDINELRQFARNHAFIELPITSEYTQVYIDLPDYHKDPFEWKAGEPRQYNKFPLHRKTSIIDVFHHMPIAQAITCPMRLITSDAILAKYSSLVMII